MGRCRKAKTPAQKWGSCHPSPPARCAFPAAFADFQRCSDTAVPKGCCAGKLLPPAPSCPARFPCSPFADFQRRSPCSAFFRGHRSEHPSKCPRAQIRRVTRVSRHLPPPASSGRPGTAFGSPFPPPLHVPFSLGAAGPVSLFLQNSPKSLDFPRAQRYPRDVKLHL